MTQAASANPLDPARPANATPLAARGGSRLTPLVTLYLLTLRRYLHGKRWMVMAGLFLLPAGLALLIRATSRDVQPMRLDFLLAFMFIPQALLPLVALVYASGMIQDEQEEQTITYLLVRPIPKWALYCVKLLATITTAVLLTIVFTVLTYAAIYIGADSRVKDVPLRCLQAAGIHSLAVVAYCSLFGLLSVLTKRPLVWGILYAAFVEGLLANLPFSIRLVTVIYYTRIIAFRSLEFIVSSYGRTENLAAEAWKLDIAKDPKLLEHPQTSTCLIVLLAGSLACTALAALLCSGR